jgi:hypothetical protein
MKKLYYLSLCKRDYEICKKEGLALGREFKQVANLNLIGFKLRKEAIVWAKDKTSWLTAFRQDNCVTTINFEFPL